MKWNKAVAQIEEALAAGKDVLVLYHRKWMPNDSHIMYVESVSEYKYKGQICKAVSVTCGAYDDGIDEGSHIIDKVTVEKEGE